MKVPVRSSSLCFLPVVARYAIVPLNYGSKENFWGTFIAHVWELLGYFSVFLIVIIYGVRMLKRRYPAELPFLLVPLIVTPLLALLLSLKAPMLSDRYLVVVFPFFIALLAPIFVFDDGISTVFRKSRLLVAVFNFGSLAHHFNDTFGFTQWREASRFVQSRVSSNDLVVVNPDYCLGVFQYYFKDSAQVLALNPKVESVVAFVQQLYKKGGGLRDKSFWLIESGNLPSLKGAFLALGLEVREEIIFPLENGVRVFHLRLT